MFELKNISIRYGELVALKNVSITFDTGSVTTLIGPSGCGKTTLLNTLNGLNRPDDGQLLIDGSPLSDTTAARQNIGYVLQNGGLFPHMTALENATLPMRLHDWSPSKIDDRVQELAALVQLDDPQLLTRYPSQLSGGQKQRVGIMRALALDPDALLLDEPLGALDPLVRRDLQDDLKTIFKALKKTVVFVTHDMAEAAFIGDRIVMMNLGEIEQVGTYDELQHAPASEFVQKFLNAHDRRTNS